MPYNFFADGFRGLRGNVQCSS